MPRVIRACLLGPAAGPGPRRLRPSPRECVPGKHCTSRSSGPGHVMPGPTWGQVWPRPSADGFLANKESVTGISPKPLQVVPIVTSHTSASGSETGWVLSGVFSGAPASRAEPSPRVRRSALFSGDMPPLSPVFAGLLSEVQINPPSGSLTGWPEILPRPLRNALWRAHVEPRLTNGGIFGGAVMRNRRVNLRSFWARHGQWQRGQRRRKGGSPGTCGGQVRMSCVRARPAFHAPQLAVR